MFEFDVSIKCRCIFKLRLELLIRLDTNRDLCVYLGRDFTFSLVCPLVVINGVLGFILITGGGDRIWEHKIIITVGVYLTVALHIYFVHTCILRILHTQRISDP